MRPLRLYLARDDADRAACIALHKLLAPLERDGQLIVWHATAPWPGKIWTPRSTPSASAPIQDILRDTFWVVGPGRTTHFQVGATRISFPVYIVWGLLVGFYGMFVPNTFRRGGAVLLVRTLAAGATLLAAAMVNPALRPHVDWVFKADQPYTDTAGTRLFVTDSVGWIRNSVNTMMTGGIIWSGLQWDGTTGLTCMGWSVTTFPPTANAGFNTNPGSMLLSAGTTACSSSIPVLCVEQ